VDEVKEFESRKAKDDADDVDEDEETDKSTPNFFFTKFE